MTTVKMVAVDMDGTFLDDKSSTTAPVFLPVTTSSASETSGLWSPVAINTTNCGRFS